MVLNKSQNIEYVYGFREEYSFLSNFHLVNILYEGVTYPSVENYYVALKSNSNQVIEGIKYSNEEFRIFISKQPPNKAKNIGKKINIRSDWDSIKLKVMFNGLRIKFSNPTLKNRLIGTNDLYLIESNYWHDNFWGSCYCPRCNNKGKNHLGKIIMDLRKELKDEQFFF